MYNPFTLENKTILVTGASSGIGRAIAIECSRMGANVILNGRDELRLRETLDQLDGNNHLIKSGDLTDDNFLVSLVSELPVLDGLVLSAGIVKVLPTMFASKEKFIDIYNTNLFSAIELLRLIIKKKRFNKNLSVVALSSIAGNIDIVPGNGIYGSGKAALSTFMKYMALETASKNIRINTVSPGFIRTPMHEAGAINDEQINKIIDEIPMRKWGEPKEVAYSTVFLLSDASSYITGADIRIDGGYSI